MSLGRPGLFVCWVSRYPRDHDKYAKQRNGVSKENTCQGSARQEHTSKRRRAGGGGR
jgi:hypothetical protein